MSWPQEFEENSKISTKNSNHFQLYIRGVPIFWTQEHLFEFFQFFGVTSVQRLKGKFEGICRIRFNCEKKLEEAKGKLDNLKVLNSSLKVLPFIINNETKRQFFPQVQGFKDALRYNYPPPSPEIVSRISESLLSVPAFYLEVLNLMNKMSLPCPFFKKDSSTLEVSPLNQETLSKKRKISDVSSSESELESEDENEDTTEMIPKRTVKQDFSSDQIDSPSPQSLNLTTKSKKKFIPIHLLSEKSSSKTFISPSSPTPTIPSPSLPTNESEYTIQEYPSIEEIESNKTPLQDIMNSFPNYKEGEISQKLYIKNIHKKVTKLDLQLLFRHLFSSESEMNEIMELNLMEGRMKGQAFVTFPNTNIAELALKHIHRYNLHGKPLIIVFFFSRFVC